MYKNEDSNESILVLIERKTYDDLSTSIKDGRYKEQKNRILNKDNYFKKEHI